MVWGEQEGPGHPAHQVPYSIGWPLGCATSRSRPSRLQFSKGPGAALTNPAVLAGVGGILSQVAMQQQMQEMTEYLAVIDEKIDDLIRADRDAVLSELDGVGLALDEGTAIGAQGVDAVRRVSVDAAGRTGDLTQRARGAVGDATSAAKDKAVSAAARVAGIRLCRQRDESSSRPEPSSDDRRP